MSNAPFVALRDAMNARNLERYDEVDIVLTALLAEQHAVLIGPPGTGKSRLATDVTSAIGGNIFTYLFGKYTTPEDVFGPFKISQLENDVFERNVSGKLPEADVAFLDEIFKASSSILNALLTIMNEKKFDNNGRHDVPLRTIIGASNELPDGEELGAMFDRFHFRKRVDYIREPENFVNMLIGSDVEIPQVTSEELNDAYREIREVKFPDTAYELMHNLRSDLSSEGIIVSDRRYKNSVHTLKAYAWLYGATTVDDDHFNILQHVFWTSPQEIRQVARVILSRTNELNMKAEDLLDEIEEIAAGLNTELQRAKADGMDSGLLVKQGVEWFKRCRNISSELTELERRAEDQGRSPVRIGQVRNRLNQVSHTIASKTLGINVDEALQAE